MSLRRSARIATQQQQKQQMESPITPTKRASIIVTPSAPQKQKKAIQRMPRNVETLITVKKIDFDYYEELDYDGESIITITLK